MARFVASDNLVIRRLIVIVFIVFLTLIITCTEANEDDTIWLDDRPQFITRDVEVAQNEVPFKIILPTYLPESIILPPQIQGFTKEVYSQDDVFLPSVPLSVSYKKTDQGYPVIVVVEYYAALMTYPSDESTYINIHGVEVLEQEEKQLMISESDTNLAVRLSYRWNFDSRHFSVNILGYEQDECRKIVESIIKQLE